MKDGILGLERYYMRLASGQASVEMGKRSTQLKRERPIQVHRTFSELSHFSLGAGCYPVAIKCH
jgi:hypothetical protein